MRLPWPTAVHVMSATLAVAGARMAGASAAELAQAGWLVAVQPWFLPVYLPLIAATPVILTALPLAAPAVMAAVAAAMDVGVVGAGLPLIGYANYLLVWQCRARYVPSSRTCTGRRATLDRARIGRCARACLGLPQRHPGKAQVHDHQHPGRAAGHRDRQLRLPAAEDAHPGIDRRVRSGLGQRHHPGLGEPRRLAPGVYRAAERGPVNLRVRHVEGEPVHRGHPHPRQNAPARPGGATGPASRRKSASITPAPSRCRARVNEDLSGIASSIPSSAPTRFSATSSWESCWS